jgi:hypothetical protein
MEIFEKYARVMTRRTFLGRASTGIGSMALASLLNRGALAADDPRIIHHAPKAKAGDPALHDRRHVAPRDVRLPAEARADGRPGDAGLVHQGAADRAAPGRQADCYGPQVAFRRFGKNGVEMSEHFPEAGRRLDEVCVVRSLVTEQINHDPAHTFMNTGTSISGRPSMGSWLWYGLGADCDNLPRLRGAHLQRPRRAEPADRDAPVVERLHPLEVPGRPLPVAGRAGPLPRAIRRA